MVFLGRFCVQIVQKYVCILLVCVFFCYLGVSCLVVIVAKSGNVCVCWLQKSAEWGPRSLFRQQRAETRDQKVESTEQRAETLRF